MSRNSNAQKLEQVKDDFPNLLVVTPSNKPATEAEAEAPAKEAQPANESATLVVVTRAELTPEALEREKQAKAEVTPKAPAPVKLLTIDEIKRKNEVLRRLTAKYDDVSLKLWRIENFKISSDRESSNVFLTDANGENFQSNSPKTIGKIIEFWTDEFKTALAEIEREIRENA